MAAIDLYTFSTPNGYKASIVLEEAGLDFDVHRVDVGKGDLNDFPNVLRRYSEIAGRPAVRNGMPVPNPEFVLPRP